MINVPPFPPLRDESGEWEGTDVLGSWVGYRGREDAEPSRGEVEVHVLGGGGDAGRPAAEQVAAYEVFKGREAEVTGAILEAVLGKYGPLLREWRKEYPEMPELGSVADLKGHICPHTVYVHDIARDGVAYIGVEFWCTWDPEHDLGVVLLGTRVTEVGEAEVSFSVYCGEGDRAVGGVTQLSGSLPLCSCWMELRSMLAARARRATGWGRRTRNGESWLAWGEHGRVAHATCGRGSLV